MPPGPPPSNVVLYNGEPVYYAGAWVAYGSGSIEYAYPAVTELRLPHRQYALTLGVRSYELKLDARTSTFALDDRPELSLPHRAYTFTLR